MHKLLCTEIGFVEGLGCLGIKKTAVFFFQLRSGAAPLEMMASSQEKATSGVLRNAAALLDEMQLMGETQGEC